MIFLKRNFTVDAIDMLSGQRPDLHRNQGGVAVGGMHHGCLFEEDPWLPDGRHDGHPGVH